MKISKDALVAMLANMGDDEVDNLLEAVEEEKTKKAEAKEEFKKVAEVRKDLINAMIEYLNINPVAEALGWKASSDMTKEREKMELAILDFERDLAEVILKGPSNKCPKQVSLKELINDLI